MYVNRKALMLPGLCKRTDCHFYSKPTKTCDYRLITGKGRGCSVDNCDKWKKRGRKRNPFNQIPPRSKRRHPKA